jgi:SPP1 family predicted phage head-tail adaptor
MSFDALLINDLVIKRSTPSGTFDDYGQPVMTETPVATVLGRLQPRSVREVMLASQAGVEVGTHVAFLRPIDLASGDWFGYDGHRFDVVGIREIDGRTGPHHVEVDLRSVD